MSSDYLKQNTLGLKDEIDCVLTSNFDEQYSEVYPKIKKKASLKLCAYYPSGDYRDIKKKIKKHFGIKTDIVFGSGSEELIIRLNDISKLKNYHVAFITPIFYRVRETFSGKKTLVKEEDIFSLDYKDYDVVWLQNPNLFSGNIQSEKKLEGLLKKFPLVNFFVDEAGIFSLPNWEKYSLLKKCHLYKNLIVLSTFSKIYGLSGLRVGFAAGDKNLLLELEKSNLTFPLSSFAEYYLSQVLEKEDVIKKIRLKIESHKRELMKILGQDNNFIIKKTLVNCLFFKHKKENIYDHLLKQGIISLDLNNYPEITERGYVRLTVHSSDIIHKKIVSRLKKIISNIKN